MPETQPRYALALISPAYIAEAMRKRWTMLQEDLDLRGSGRVILPPPPTTEILGRMAELRYWLQWVESIGLAVEKEGDQHGS